MLSEIKERNEKLKNSRSYDKLTLVKSCGKQSSIAHILIAICEVK